MEPHSQSVLLWAEQRQKTSTSWQTTYFWDIFQITASSVVLVLQELNDIKGLMLLCNGTMWLCGGHRDRELGRERLRVCVPKWERKKQQAVSGRNEEISNVQKMNFHVKKDEHSSIDHFNWLSDPVMKMWAHVYTGYQRKKEHHPLIKQREFKISYEL